MGRRHLRRADGAGGAWPAGGRRATCYPGMEPEMCGAVMQNAGVVRDGNFITGRAAGSAFAFGLALVEALCGAETAARIAAQVVWNGEEASHD